MMARASQARHDLAAYSARLATLGKTLSMQARAELLGFATAIYDACGRTDFVSFRSAHNVGSGSSFCSFLGGAGSLSNGPTWGDDYVAFVASGSQYATLPASWKWNVPGTLIGLLQLPGSTSSRTALGGLQSSSSSGIVLGTSSAGATSGVIWFSPAIENVSVATSGMYGSAYNSLAVDFGADTRIYRNGSLLTSDAALPTTNSYFDGVRIARHGEVTMDVNMVFALVASKSLTADQHAAIWAALQNFYPDLLS